LISARKMLAANCLGASVSEVSGPIDLVAVDVRRYAHRLARKLLNHLLRVSVPQVIVCVPNWSSTSCDLGRIHISTRRSDRDVRGEAGMVMQVVVVTSVVLPGAGRGPGVVVERFEFAQRVQQVGLVKDEGAVEKFGSAGPDPALHDRVHPWYADPGRDRGDAAVGNNRVESGGLLACTAPILGASR
jgi:hypothetical protein